MYKLLFLKIITEKIEENYERKENGERQIGPRLEGGK